MPSVTSLTHGGSKESNKLHFSGRLKKLFVRTLKDAISMKSLKMVFVRRLTNSVCKLTSTGRSKHFLI